MYDSWLTFVRCTTSCSWAVIYGSVLWKISFFLTTLAVSFWRTGLSACPVFVVAAVVLSAFYALFPSKLVARWRNFLLMWLCQQLAHTEDVLAVGFHVPASESWLFLLLLRWWSSNGLHYLREQQTPILLISPLQHPAQHISQVSVASFKHPAVVLEVVEGGLVFFAFPKSMQLGH